MPERTDLDGKEGRQESEADRPAKPADVAGKFIDDDVVGALARRQRPGLRPGEVWRWQLGRRRAHLDAASTGSSGICTLLTGGAPLTSCEKMRAAVKGRLVKRTPVAFLIAFAIAGATALIAHSPCDFAPSGPILS
jgi:hypothetical protein